MFVARFFELLIIFIKKKQNSFFLNFNCFSKISFSFWCSSRPTYRPQFVPQRQLPQPQLNYQILRGRSRTRQGNNVHLDSSIRSTEETQSLYRELKTLFSERDQEEIVNNVLCDYPSERDLNRLSNICVQMLFGN